MKNKEYYKSQLMFEVVKQSLGFNRESLRKHYRSRVRNSSLRTMHSNEYKSALNIYEQKRQKNVLKNTRKDILASIPKDKGVGILRKWLG